MTSGSQVPAGWYDDPVSRHEYRYWDGSRWTAYVADGGVTTEEPLDVGAAPTASGGVVATANEAPEADSTSRQAGPLGAGPSHPSPEHDDAPVPTAFDWARDLVGPEHFFGPGEWKRFFAGALQFDEAPEIRWSADELRQPGLSQPHFLFLGMQNLEGMSLEMPSAYGTPFEEVVHWYRDHVQRFAGGTYELRWYHMPVGTVAGLWNLTYGVQVAHLPPAYEVPTATERLTANVLYHLLNGEYLDDFIHDARTRSQRVHEDLTLYTLIRIEDGQLTTWEATDAAAPNFGIAASRTLAN